MKKILFITDAYPRNAAPDAGVFVYNLVQNLVKLGNQVTVVAFEFKFRGMGKAKVSYGEERANVKRTGIISFGAFRIGHWNTYSLVHFQKKMAVKRAIGDDKSQFDFVYCHFITSLMFSYEEVKKLNVPIFVAVGENKGMDTLFQRHSSKFISNALSKVTAFIAVSNVVSQRLQDVFNIPETKIRVIPNGVDRSRFLPLEKNRLRLEKGIDEKDFVLIFVGRFIHSKGPDRVLAAIEGLDNVKILFVGEGNITLLSDKILFQGKLPNHILPEYYNIADAFILPTLHEGSNNSIIEAMACGLPIISSDIPEIREQCTPDYSILVDPMNITEIQNAIIQMKSNPQELSKMSQSALNASVNFDLFERANKIYSFIENQIEGFSKKSK